MWDDKPFREELESLGEVEVRRILARGDQWAALENRKNVAFDWLREKESAKRDAREDEAIAIAREANDIASRAERWAMYAAIAAVIALIVSLFGGKN